MVALEAAQDPDHCLRRRADHIGHVLPRQPHRQPQPASFLDAASGTEIDQQRGQPLIGTIQRKDFILFLRLMQTVREMLNDLNCGIRIALQHIEVGRLVHAENADIAHRLGRPWMTGTIKGSGIATEEVAWHEHFERAFFPVRRGFDAFHHSLLDNVEVLGGLAFAKDEVFLAVPGFGQVPEDALAILPAQYAEERHAVEHVASRKARPFT